jgi:hypothetical protein
VGRSQATKAGGETGGLIAHRELFGPLWVDVTQHMYLTWKNPGEPEFIAETPVTPVGRNGATVLVFMKYPSKRKWMLVLKDAAGKLVAKEKAGIFKRWKTRLIINTAHLSVGRYSLEILPANGKRDDMWRVPATRIEIVPAFD